MTNAIKTSTTKQRESLARRIDNIRLRLCDISIGLASDVKQDIEISRRIDKATEALQLAQCALEEPRDGEVT